MLCALTLLASVLAAAQQTAAQENQRPLAIAYTLTGGVVSPGDVITLVGTSSTDPEGSPLTYEWSFPPSFRWIELSNPTGDTASFTVPTLDLAGDLLSHNTLQVSLVVADILGERSLPYLLTLTVNSRPTVDGFNVEVKGDDGVFDEVEALLSDDDAYFEVPEGAEVRIRGDRVLDSEDDLSEQRLSFAWRQVFGVPVELSVPTGVAPTFIAPRHETSADVLSYDPIVLVFELVVTDSHGLSSVAETLRVSVQEVDDPPVPDAGPDQDVVFGQVVHLDPSGTSDPDAYEVLPGDPDGPPTVLYTYTLVDVVDRSGDSVRARRGGPLLGGRRSRGGLSETDIGSFDSSRSEEGIILFALQEPSDPEDPLWDVVGNELVLRLTLSDSDGEEIDDFDEVYLSVQGENSPPEAQARVFRLNERAAANELDVSEGQSVVLSAAGSRDPDRDAELTYTWTQLEPVPEYAIRLTQESSVRECVNCAFGRSPEHITSLDEYIFTPTGTLTGLEPEDDAELRYLFALTVSDQWGEPFMDGYDPDGATSDGDEEWDVVVNVQEVNEPPEVEAGEDQEVEPGATVTLSGSAVDHDPGEQDDLVYTWSQLAGPTVTLSDPNAVSPTFDIPEGPETNFAFLLVVTDPRRGSGSDSVSVKVSQEALFYSGKIDGPDYCTNLSLGGPRTFAFDSVGDGVADTCVLSVTRREAVAQQNALEALATAKPQRFRELVVVACADVDTFGEADEESDVCATGEPGAPPSAAERPAEFFSGLVVTGPEFCTNLSLGGPRTYPFDSNGDGVADICTLPWTRREAAARQHALEALRLAFLADYEALFVAECAVVEGFDDPNEATDGCARVSG